MQFPKPALVWMPSSVDVIAVRLKHKVVVAY